MPRDLSVPSRETTTLSGTIDHRAKVYSVAAAAAGVTMLALAPPAAAKVVVHGTNLPINPVADSNVIVSLDINHDGIADFKFSLSSFAYHSFNAILEVTPLAGGAVVASPGSGSRQSYASALVRGAKVGPSAHFSSKGRATIERSHGVNFSSRSSRTRHTYGKWSGDSTHYLGVKFLIDGATHYGWIRMTVNSTAQPINATITAYAYETVANKRILAGIPASGTGDTQAQPKAERLGHPSLGMLALGADGLALWRRDEPLAAVTMF
jgi:hypothetical protein